MRHCSAHAARTIATFSITCKASSKQVQLYKIVCCSWTDGLAHQRMCPPAAMVYPVLSAWAVAIFPFTDGLCTWWGLLPPATPFKFQC